jgi:glycosyltransferase involved in cell wall biosynthesis
LDAVSEPLPVSVVIPAYNRPAMVSRAVRSALDQRPRPPAEVIVVDDCSSDDTADAASAAGATVIRHDVNRGGAAARNTAIRAAAHDWIAFLDSDDELLPNHLEALWPERDGHVILGSSAIACAPDPAYDSLIGRAGRSPEVLDRPESVLRHGNVLVTSSVIVRRDVAIAAGLFTEGMKRSADLDLWLRILERGTGYVSPVVTVRYHQHSGQVTDDLTKTFDAYAAIVDAYRGRAELSRSAGAGAEARLLWDRLRLDLRLGRRGAALKGLWRIVRDPYKAPGLLDLLGHRILLRRRRRSYTRSGAPSIRVWTSSAELVADARGRGLATLDPVQRRGFWAGLFPVLRRPAGMTVTDSAVRAAVARVAGSQAVRVRPGATGALDELR